jgi:hypothetical protein
MASNLRTVKRLNPTTKDWDTVEFANLRKGDIFRMWEPNGEIVYQDHIQNMEATSDATFKWIEMLQREDWIIEAKAA